ncbi:MAG: hypothetical protein RIS35_1058, partial [Pseudomonadota bacterium]
MSPLSLSTDFRTFFAETSESRFRDRETGRELIIADGCAPDIVQLLEQADTRWIAVGHGTNPVASISTALAGERLETLHLVAHGRSGALRIGGHEIDTDALLAQAGLLAGWNVRRIALWACEAGADSRFVETLARLTGAEVACTDAVIRGGDLSSWRLENNGGARIPFPEAALRAWHGTLTVVDTDGDGVPDSSDADDDNDGILDVVEQLVELPVLSDLVQYSLAQNIYGYDTRHDAAGGFGTGGSEDPKLLFDGDPTTELKVHEGDLFEFTFNGLTLTAGSQFTLQEGTGKNDGWVQIFGTLATTDPQGDTQNATGGGDAWSNLSSYFSPGTLPSTTTLVTTPIIANAGAGAGKAVLLYQGPSAASVPIVNIPIDIKYLQIVGLETHGGFGEMSVITLNASSTDTDGDNISNQSDLDSDNDGISDLVEGVGALASSAAMKADTNNDGTISKTEAQAYVTAKGGTLDANADGLWDFLAPGTTPVDTDGDGVFDFVDLDSDNDGIPDTVEARLSKGYVANDGNVSNDAGSDGDGVIGLFDTVSGFGGSFGLPVNTDGDAAKIGGGTVQNITGAVWAGGSADWQSPDSSTFQVLQTRYTSGADSVDGTLDNAADGYAKLKSKDSDALVLDFGSTLAAGTKIVISGASNKDLATGYIRSFTVNAAEDDKGATDIAGTSQVFTFTKAKTVPEDFEYTVGASGLRYLEIKAKATSGTSVDDDELRLDYVAGTKTAITDAIPDYLDLDSDNDGFTDQQESGLARSGKDTNGDGLDDSVGGGYSDPDGLVNAPFTNLANVDAASDDVDYRSVLYDVQVSNVEVNEAGGYAVFSVSGPTVATNVYLSLGLDTDPTTANADSNDRGSTIQYWSGTAWTNYTANTAQQVPANGELLVRVSITNDTAPGIYEGPEVFRLVANYGTGLATQVNATKIAQGGFATIYDDGTGSKFAFDNNSDGTPTETTGPGAGFDDDRPIEIDNISVNEGSDYGVFTLTGPSGAQLTLSLATTSNFTGPGTRDPETQVGDATLDADTTATAPNSLWFSVDGGAHWSQYNSSTNKPTIPASGTVYVRVGIENDTNFEGREQFRLVAERTNPSGGTLFSASDDGIGTIRDDGNGNYWLGSLTGEDGPTAPASPQELDDNKITLDDDSPISLSNVVVNEGSGWAAFDLEGSPGIHYTLASQNGSAKSVADFDLIEWWDGAKWVDVTGEDLSLDASGHGQLRVRIVNDDPAVLEGPETFTLVATSSSGVASTGGQGTIVDD